MMYLMVTIKSSSYCTTSWVISLQFILLLILNLYLLLQFTNLAPTLIFYNLFCSIMSAIVKITLWYFWLCSSNNILITAWGSPGQSQENNQGLILKRKKWRINGARDLLWKANGLLSWRYFNWQSVKVLVYWPTTTKSLVYVFSSLWYSSIKVILGYRASPCLFQSVNIYSTSHLKHF